MVGVDVADGLMGDACDAAATASAAAVVELEEPAGLPRRTLGDGRMGAPPALLLSRR